MPEDIAVRYRWSVEELTEATRWHLRQGAGRGVRIFYWAMIVAFTGMAVGFHLLGRHYAHGRSSHRIAEWYGVFAAVYFALLLILQQQIARWRMRRSYAKSATRDAELEWQINETNLRVKYIHGLSEVRWQAFNKAVLTPKGLLLYPQPLTFQWLPRHGFENEAEFDAVVEMARRQIPAFRQLH